MGEFAKQIQLRRGTTAEHASFVGAEGEVTMDTTKKTLVIHDGRTIGGFPVPTRDEIVNKVDRSELDNYRPKNNKITINDLDEDLKTEVKTKYNDTEIKQSISDLQTGKLNRSELTAELANYRKTSTKIGLTDLDTTVSDSINSIAGINNSLSEVNSTLQNKANSSDLENFREKETKIEESDLSNSIKNTLSNVNTNTSSINALTARMSDVERDIDSLKNNSGSGSGGSVNLDGYATTEDLNNAVSNIENSIAEANRTHATITKVESLETTVNDNTSKISTIEGKIESINTTIEGIKNNGGSSSGDGGGSSDVSSAEFNALKSTVEKNTAGVSENKTNISANTSSINSLDTRVTTVESSVANAKNVADEAKRTADSLSSSIESAVSLGNTNKSNISSLTETVNGYSSRLNTAESNANDAKTTAAEASTSINLINKNIGSNENAESILGRITNLERNSGVGVKHNELDGLNEGDYLHLTASEKDDYLAMSGTLAELIVNFNALKKQVESGSTSSGSTNVYTDNQGRVRQLKFNIFFTTNSSSRELKKFKKFNENGYSLPTAEDYAGPNYEDDIFVLSNIEMYYHGIADYPNASGTYLPREGVDESLDINDTNFPVKAYNYDPETGLLTFTGKGTSNIYLFEFRVYEPLS